MNKKVLLLALLGALAGLGLGVFQAMQKRGQQTQAQDLFPADKLNGYVQGTSVPRADVWAFLNSPAARAAVGR